MPITESDYEQAIIELFQKELGYDYIYGYKEERDYTQPLFIEKVKSSLLSINPTIEQEAIDEAINKIKSIDNGSIVQKNEQFMEYLQNGIDVNYYNGKENAATHLQLIDYNSFEKNSFVIANQWTVEETEKKRCDVVVFVNGFPIVVMELKSPSREETDITDAYLQIRNYMKVVPTLFVYNAFCVISDLSYSKAGTITANEDRFMQWKTIDGEVEDNSCANFDVMFKGMFDKKRLLDIIHNFICFSHEEKQSVKILAGYHQYYAVKKAIESTKKATKTDGKGGVFWHTQGSGKSLSMVFYVKLLQQAFTSPTVVMVTDRNDLDDQLYSQFIKCKDFLRQRAINAESRKNLRELLNNRKANGIFFTTMQKFEDSDEELSDRRDIIVVADEAHRSQYGLEERVDSKTGEVRVGAARKVRNALPNATFLGFTGTPISFKDRSTKEVFGDYIDVYDMTQAVRDGATRPVFYESRVIKLKLDKDVLKRIDEEYDSMAEEADDYSIEKSKKQLGKIDSIFGAKETIDSLCNDIVNHYEDYRQYEQTGKAMIVAYSRPIAIKIYHKILSMRPLWKDKLAVIMTSSNQDPEDWQEIIGNKTQITEKISKFKDDDSKLKIVIVVDMLLTGFDVPSLCTMYVYKPMKGHNLMQAIARVNRVYKDKEGGLIVDYVGIASALKEAMKQYTKRDIDNYGDMDIAKTALKEFEKKMEVCQNLMHGFDYSAFFLESNNNYDRVKIITQGSNFLLSPDKEEIKQSFIKEAYLLHQSESLCGSILNKRQRIEAAYFEAIRNILTRIVSKHKLSFKEINDRINELLKQSIKSEGVINLFSDIKEKFSLFDEKFLKEISQMKEKNLAVEILNKLIAEQVKLYKKTNYVRAEKFSEILSNAMSNYLKGLLTNEQVIDELIKTAQSIINGEKDSKELNLSNEELAFYDAISKPEAAKDFYSNEQLVAMTKELTDMLRKNKTIDWNRKESARAGMRMLVKRLLKKYNYPPEGEEYALETVMKQCELWSEDN